MITYEIRNKANEMIQYYNTLTLEQYLKEPKKERHLNLRIAFMNKIPKPDYVNTFAEEKLKPLEIKRKETEDLESSKWIKEKWKNWNIIRYTEKYIHCAKEEEWANNVFKYKSSFIVKIDEKPISAKAIIQYITYTSDNPKYEKLFEPERFDKFKNYINNLEIKY